MFLLADRPHLYPGRTLFGDTQGPVVDTGVEMVFGGRVYLAVVEAIHVGKAVDMVEGNVHEAEIAERDERIAALEQQVAELSADRVNVVSLDEVRELIAAGASSKKAG